MSIPTLSAVVERFVAQTSGLNDEQLNLPWAWGSYTSEGVRFAYFRILEELRLLGIRLQQARANSDQPLTTAHRILGQYHTTFRDLEAVLLGLSPEESEQRPGPEEWAVRQAAAHITNADVTFFAILSLTLKRIRAGQEPPQSLPDGIWDPLVDMPILEFDKMLEGPMEPLRAFHRTFHSRVLKGLADASDEELSTPSYFWEDTPMPIRFRLGRFESHCRQHLIQIEKTRNAIGRPLSEAQILGRALYQALAAVEATEIGEWNAPTALLEPTKNEINMYASEVMAIVSA